MKNSITVGDLTLTNFKGIKNQTVHFNEEITNIFGANETGKTSLYDAWLWLLFGKNSDDKKDFSIKNTKDKSLNRADHEVSGNLIINGTNVNLRKVYKEIWRTKKGNETAEFTGHETEYFYDGIPMQQKDFQSRISEVLDEKIFKVLTNPLAFNSMKWQERREMISAMFPISDEDIASGNEVFEKLLKDAKAYKSLEEYKKMVNATIKKSREEIKLIPARIDENIRQKPEALDFISIQSNIDSKNESLVEIDNQIQNANSGIEGIVSKRREQSIVIGNLENQITNIESAARNEANKPDDNSELTNLNSKLKSKKADLETATNGLKTLSDSISNKNNKIVELDNSMAAKRKEWEKENAKELTFNDDDFHCPTCKREFETGDITNKKLEFTENFLKNKNLKIQQINTAGSGLKQEKENLETEVKNLSERIETGKTLVTDLEAEIVNITTDIETYNSGVSSEPKDVNLIYECILSENEDYKSKKATLQTLKSELVEVPEVDNSAFISQRKTLIDEIDNLKGQMNLKIQIDACDSRIVALNNEEKRLAQEIANVEKIEFAIDRFNKLKVDTLENEINKKFKYVKFRMFEDHINGGQTECCDALIDGVPFTDANTASKINAGIDIINTLCEFYQVSAPIFIDNRESIVNLIPCESQIVNLIVSGEDKKLRVA